MQRQEKRPVWRDRAAVPTSAALILGNQDCSTVRGKSQGVPDLAGLLGQAKAAEVAWRDCLAAGDRAGADLWRRRQLNAQAEAWALGVRP